MSRERLFASATIIVLLTVALIAVASMDVNALTGNIDVDKAIPDINNAIEHMTPYEPTPWERFLWFIKDIFEGWWKP